MNLPPPEILLGLSTKTLATIVVLQQIATICGSVQSAKGVVPAAQEAKQLMDALLAALVDDERYTALLAPIANVINLVAGFDAAQVQTVGGMVTRIPQFIGAALPQLVALG